MMVAAAMATATTTTRRAMMMRLLWTLPIVVVFGSSAHYSSSSSSSGFAFGHGHSRRWQLQVPPATHPTNYFHAPPHYDRRRILEAGWYHHRCRTSSLPSSSTTTLLRTKSLRDIMDDNTNNHSATHNSSRQQQQLQEQQQQQQQQNEQQLLLLQQKEQKHQRLTKQLANLSTQEIKRELEHVHGFGVSTLALLRGKSSLVEALVDARLRREEDEEEEEVVEVANIEEVMNVGNNSRNSRNNSNSNTRIEDMNGKAVMVVPGVGNVVTARPSSTTTLSSTDYVVTVIPGVGNVVGTGGGGKNAASSVVGATPWNAMFSNNNIGDDGSGVDAINNQGPIATNNNGNVAEASTAESSDSNWYSSNAISEKGYMYNDIDEELQQLQQWQLQQQQQQQQIQPEYNNDDTSTTTTSTTPDNNSNTKLRELQIAYEFERVQSTMSSPDDVRSELETKFGIGTKYFLGTKEMEYALAVARVEYAIERRLRLGLSLDGEECIDFYDDADDDEKVGDYSLRRNNPAMETCQDLPTPEDLIAIEYDNLLVSSWDEDALSEELESQYGIPAKHFLGKKEMAYALAVERVDRAMKEGGGYILDDDDDDDYDVAEEDEDDEEGVSWDDEGIDDSTGYYAVMTDEDMMKMMEEEMSKEREEEKVLDEPIKRTRREEMRGNPAARATTTVGGAGSVRGASSSSSFGKIFKKEQPNPFIQTKGPTSTSSSQLQTTPLAEMIKNNDKRERRPPPKRTPLSSEPPLGRQRLTQNQQYQNRQNPIQMGTVIGEGSSSSRDSKSLADILKGSEERQRIRTQAVMPPPRPNVQDRPMSSPYDDPFMPVGGGRGSANTFRSTGSMNGAPVYGYSATNINDVGSRGSNSSGRSESNTRATQRPFEPAPFTEPGTHNAQGRSSSASRQPGGFGVGPQRIPPQTPFTSPVTDGARRSSGTTSSSQGPFTPFTEPGKRSTNNKPPSRKRPSDPRRFNIKDTPDQTQPFVTGSYVDYNTPYSPPLQVEPPPRDPRYQPPERPFEPAPYSDPGARAAGSGANREATGPKYGPYRQNQENTKGYTPSSSPFDKWKDMFSSTKWGGDKKKEVEKEEPKGFKSGNVEVLLSDNSDDGIWSPVNKVVGTPIDKIRQQALVVEIIDAEQRIKSSRDMQDEDDIIRDAPISQPGAEFLPNAWKGGPEAVASTFQDKRATKSNTTTSQTNTSSNSVMQKANNILTTNPDIRAIVAKAQTNPKLRQAVNECMGNPFSFGLYLNDPDIGPILNELKQCISRQ